MPTTTFALLGPLSVVRDGSPVELGPPQRRAVLALLLLAGGRAVSRDRLVEDLWGAAPPRGATTALQAHLSRLRGALAAGPGHGVPLVRRPGGYALEVDPADLDVTRFLSTAAAGRTALEKQRWRDAAACATEALAVWRGPYLDDLAAAPWAGVAAAPLEEHRADVQLDLVTALLGCGDTAQALLRSCEALAAQPLSERATWLRCVALHRSGRSVDALELLRRSASRFVRELGVDLGPGLRDLQEQLLRHDPALASWPGRG